MTGKYAELVIVDDPMPLSAAGALRAEDTIEAARFATQLALATGIPHRYLTPRPQGVVSTPVIDARVDLPHSPSLCIRWHGANGCFHCRRFRCAAMRDAVRRRRQGGSDGRHQDT